MEGLARRENSSSQPRREHEKVERGITHGRIKKIAGKCGFDSGDRLIEDGMDVWLGKQGAR